MVRPGHIQVIDASFGYHKGSQNSVIIDPSSFECGAGDFIGIAGSNGSGKSTLLRTLCGLQASLNGKILIDDRELSSYSAVDLSKKISIVLTEKIAGFNLTCFDAVAAGQMPYTGLLNKLEKQHIDIIREAMRICGIENFSDKPLSELSDGMFQKTMIAKCLAQQTPVMLLDEPTAFLDYASKHELFIQLKTLSGNKCVMVSSHDLDLIRKYCNKLLVVKNSTLQLYGNSHESWHSVFTGLSGGYL
jgi:iron complex transport system ATP-binding protein